MKLMIRISPSHLTVKKAAFGFRSFQNFKTAIFFHCGGLRLYPVTHAKPG